MCADIRGRVGSHSDICIQITDAQEENSAESESGSGTGLTAERQVTNKQNYNI